MQAIETCRTPALGGVVEWCDHCHYTHTRYRSCRNRHCPKCQGAAREKWLEQRRAELLPTEYFHVVFTLPEPIAAIAFFNKEVSYSLLFRATAETLLTIARDPKRLGVETGFFAVLHTWGQNLHFHPHLHCVVPGGGLSPDLNRWIGGRRRFFLPVRVLSNLFRRLFLEGLAEAHAAGKLQFFGDLEPLRDPPAFARYLANLALPFTRKSVGAISIGRLRVSESEPFAHDLELRVALPHQLVTRRWILGASQVSPDSRDDAHHVAQSRRRFQAFFFE